MEEVDDNYVLDTGSVDQTVEGLKKRGVHITTEVISPWRFDEYGKLVVNERDPLFKGAHYRIWSVRIFFGSF